MIWLVCYLAVGFLGTSFIMFGIEIIQRRKKLKDLGVLFLLIGLAATYSIAWPFFWVFWTFNLSNRNSNE